MNVNTFCIVFETCFSQVVLLSHREKCLGHIQIICKKKYIYISSGNASVVEIVCMKSVCNGNLHFRGGAFFTHFVGLY